MSVSYGGDSITFADSSTISSGWTGFKNRIINGAMVIDQRYAGASVSGPNAYQSVDRWKYYISTNSKFNGRQMNSANSAAANYESSSAPAGFSNSLKITSTSAYSLGSGDFFSLVQAIEGYNVQDLSFGTSSAKSVTLSFWVKSSLTGTFGGNIGNSARNRQYYFTYTITSANTWTYCTVTIPGDQTGTWLVDNGTGMLVEFCLGAGTASSVAAGSWGTSGAYGVTGAQSVVSTSGATWYITGVQVEKSSTASSFEYRPYGTELALCQRYYEEQYCQWATVWSAGMNNYSGTFKVTKRVTPTTTAVYASNSADKSGTLGSVRNTTNSADIACNAVSSESPNNFSLDYNTGGAGARNMRAYVTFSSEL